MAWSPASQYANASGVARLVGVVADRASAGAGGRRPGLGVADQQPDLDHRQHAVEQGETISEVSTVAVPNAGGDAVAR